MSPGRGGRPRLPWTSSRKRKLVRLYLLTRLEQEEIQKVLVDSGFNPSTSDMQKKLRELLPRDYAKKNLRPSNEANMARRFEQIRRCREGRVEKHRRSSQERRSRRFSSGSSDGNGLRCSSQWCFGLPTPFRNYSDTQSAFYGLHDPPVLRDSELTNSSLLLLDGSVLARTELHDEPTLPVTGPSAPISISGLGVRLGNKYAPSDLEHIDAVLRSSSGSYPSSSTSAAHSWKSRLSPKSQEAATKLVPGQRPSTCSNLGTLLSDGEQRMWDDFVDDSKADPVLLTHPMYEGIALISRLCCDLSPSDVNVDVICHQCGFSKAHRSARDSGEGAILFGQVTVKHASDKDHFGNTLLHCVAASPQPTLSAIKAFLSLGVLPESRNTSGETFLHLLPYYKFEGLDAYVNLLRLLGACKFSLAQRDYHGRTVAHILCEDPKVKALSIENLGKIFQTLAPDLHSLDNLGNSVRQHLLQWAAEALAAKDLGRHQGLSCLVEQYKKPHPLQVDFRTVLSSIPSANKVQLQWVQSTNNVTWVDMNGDTALTAVLKDWNSEDDELQLRELVKKLMESGAEIQTRDRGGDSALAIAAIRGFRSIVALLLNCGAHYHTRNYEGSGILEQTTGASRDARDKKNDKLYAMIELCTTLLIDFGAKFDPNEIDEWRTPPHLPRSDARLWQ